MVQRNRVVIAGLMGVGGENWSVGLNYQPSPSTPSTYVTTQDDLNTWADEIAAELASDDYDILRNCLSESGSGTTVVTQKFDNAGLLERQSPATDADFSGLGTAYKPYQTSIVFSLQTALPGASYRGRCYWPGTGAGIAGDGRLTTPTAPASLVPVFAQLLSRIGAVSPVADTVVPCVYSPTKGLVTPVTTIRCGDVPDTQRRRRDRLVETYSSSALP